MWVNEAPVVFTPSYKTEVQLGASVTRKVIIPKS